jgi:hypothetical protein
VGRKPPRDRLNGKSGFSWRQALGEPRDVDPSALGLSYAALRRLSLPTLSHVAAGASSNPRGDSNPGYRRERA